MSCKTISKILVTLMLSLFLAAGVQAAGEKPENGHDHQY